MADLERFREIGNDDEPGSSPIVRPLFEEWAPEAEQLRAEVTASFVTVEGRQLQPGDRVTLAQATAQGIPHVRTTTAFPGWPHDYDTDRSVVT